MSAREMDPRSPADVIEFIRRGAYEARKAISPHHPALAKVLTPISAETLLDYISDLEKHNRELREKLEKKETP